MKKILLGFAIVFAALFIALVSVPFLFGDKIKAKVDETIDQYINAKVKFSDVNLSVFQNFPNVSVGLSDFLITGKDKFEGDTLVAVKNFSLEIAITSLLEEKIKIKSVSLDVPVIRLRILKDSTSNFDIVKPQPEDPKEAEASAPFAIGVDHWEINNANILYDDATSKTKVQIVGLNHEGSGDLKTDLFDLETKTKIELLDALFAGTRYRYSLVADAVVNVDQVKSRYTISENHFQINDLPFNFTGFVEMPANMPMLMDLKFGIKESTFKNLLSLIPAIFMKGYEGLKTDGDFTFDGYAQGEYNDKTGKMPNFGINLKVHNGSFQYPQLPTAVTKIDLDLAVENKTGNLDKTVIDLKKFSMNLGNNPVSGRVKVEGLKKYLLDADVKAKVNLAELSQMFPMEGLALKGDFAIDVVAKGTYDDATQTIPNIKANMNLTQGYVKSSAYPAPLEDLNVVALAINQSGKMADTHIEISKMDFLLDKDPFSMSGTVDNLNDYTYDIFMEGKLDLDKITKIYPLENMKLSGIINADIETKGKMSDVDAGRYDKLPTSGKLVVENINFVSADLPQGMKITSSELTFSPQQMLLKNFKGFLGKSDIALEGGLDNYLAYGFHAIGLKEEAVVLKGKMSLKSASFDVNEWMSDSETPTTETAPMTVVEVPKDIDFVFNSNIKKVLYDKMTLDNMEGVIIMKDGILRMQNLAFNTVGGQFVANGTYNTQNVKKPLFDFDMNIKDLSIPAAFQTFSTVQAMAPVAKNMEGLFSTGMKLSGVLKQDMMPDYATLTGGGLLSLKNVLFNNEQIVAGINKITGKSSFSNQLKDILVKASFENGKLKTEPFEVALGESKATISGSSSFEGAIDYKVNLDLPKQEIADKINAWFGAGVADLIQDERIKLDFIVSGTYNNPKVELDKEATKAKFQGKLKDAAKEKATETATDIITQIKADTTNRPITDKAKDAIKNSGDKLKDGLNKLGIGKKKGN